MSHTPNESRTNSFFTEVEPWDEAVSGADVLKEVLAILQQYVVADAETLHAASLWISMTWLVDYATVLPLAMITAPEKGCGKSTLLTAMAKMSYNPVQASNTTAAATFRLIEAVQPTLFIDEADTFLKNDEGMRCIINSGHTRDSAHVLRVVGDELETKAFNTWCAKALCGIGHLPETIESRSIILKMRRKMAGEHAENLRHAKPAVFDTIKKKLARWSTDNAQVFAGLQPVMEGLSNRDADNYEPLLAIAMMAGDEWVSHIKKAAKSLTKSDNDNRSIGTELLDACRAMFDTLNTDRVSSIKLITDICNDEDMPFATYNRGQQITPRQLSRLLKQYGIAPNTIRFNNGGSAKGYYKKQFTEAFAAYLTDGTDIAVTTLQGCVGAGSSVTDSHHANVNKEVNVTGEPANLLGCNGVTDKTTKTPPNSRDLDKRLDDDFAEFADLLL